MPSTLETCSLGEDRRSSATIFRFMPVSLQTVSVRAGPAHRAQIVNSMSETTVRGPSLVCWHREDGPHRDHHQSALAARRDGRVGSRARAGGHPSRRPQPDAGAKRRGRPPSQCRPCDVDRNEAGTLWHGDASGVNVCEGSS